MEISLSSREQQIAAAVAIGFAQKVKSQLDLAVAGQSEGKGASLQQLADDAGSLLDSLKNGTLHIESIKEISSELQAVSKGVSEQSDPSPGTSQEDVRQLKDKIKVLEEYCLNVDYLRFQPPPALSYLFVKTTGTCEFYDNNPPVCKSAYASHNILSPVDIPEGKYSYEGEFINGLPGGQGKIIYGDRKDINDSSYSCTYTGTFLNGMKHGTGTFEVSGEGVNARRSMLRYLYDIKDGFFSSIRSSDGLVIPTAMYQNNKRQLVGRYYSPESGEVEFLEYKDDKLHGLNVMYNTETHELVIEPYQHGELKSTIVFRKIGS
jgi:MORN repeat